MTTQGILPLLDPVTGRFPDEHTPAAALAAVTAAESARDASRAARDAAKASADTAADRATAAGTAQTAAETAKTAAEGARDETIVVAPDREDWAAGARTLTQAQTRSTYLKRRLTGNVTLSVNAGLASKAYSCTLELTQDTTGGRTLLLANVATPYGIPIALSSAANAVDIVRLEWNGARWAAYLGGTQLAIPSTWIV
ncbi:hypothetical protein [Microbacterium testaceum]|uniref:hypothetical protein n=1 Tax=Microbacterium testaceum TaxID=2033 RepID=UPI0035F3C00D